MVYYNQDTFVHLFFLARSKLDAGTRSVEGLTAVHDSNRTNPNPEPKPQPIR